MVPHPEVLQGLSPTYARALRRRPPGHRVRRAWAPSCWSSPAPRRCTPTWATSAGQPIRRAWFFLVFPALTLNYLGQAALILHSPGSAAEPVLPAAARAGPGCPMVVLATAATVIASQAVISGAFSLSRQAMQLGLLPPLTVRQTSEHEGGQIYLPGVNALLFVGVLVVMLTLPLLRAARHGVRRLGHRRARRRHRAAADRGARAVALAARGSSRSPRSPSAGVEADLPRRQPVQGRARRLAAAARSPPRLHRHDHLAARTGDRARQPAAEGGLAAGVRRGRPASAGSRACPAPRCSRTRARTPPRWRCGPTSSTTTSCTST